LHSFAVLANQVLPRLVWVLPKKKETVERREMTTPEIPDDISRHEYLASQALFEKQPAIIQHFFEAQAGLLAEAMTEPTCELHFSLPDKVFVKTLQLEEWTAVEVTDEERIHDLGGFWNRMRKHEIRHELVKKLTELEQAPDLAVSTGAVLLRFATVTHMVSRVLPDGRPVHYQPDKGDSIPYIPLDGAAQSAITQKSDAIVENDLPEAGRGELQVPFVPAARCFFLPQWVAFDAEDNLLVGSLAEAEAQIKSMQRYVQILHRASSLASYIVFSQEYQRKRYGILGQLVNQGRAFARYETRQIIQTIKKRAEQSNLNRGLSISMPYFDDQQLEINTIDFEVIPAGRIMFVPAFVVRASRGEQAKVGQDTRLSASTRTHLLAQLKELEIAFFS
jgi:hypothetical protein